MRFPYINHDTCNVVIRCRRSLHHLDIRDFLSDWTPAKFNIQSHPSKSRTVLGKRYYTETVTNPESGESIAIEFYPKDALVLVQGTDIDHMSFVQTVADSLKTAFDVEVVSTSTFHMVTRHPCVEFSTMADWAGMEHNGVELTYGSLELGKEGRIYNNAHEDAELVRSLLSELNEEMNAHLPRFRSGAVPETILHTGWETVLMHRYPSLAPLLNQYSDGDNPLEDYDTANSVVDRSQFESLSQVSVAAHDLRLSILYAYYLLDEDDRETFSDAFKGTDTAFGFALAELDEDEFHDATFREILQTLKNERERVERYRHEEYPDRFDVGEVLEYRPEEMVLTFIEVNGSSSRDILLPDDAYTVRISDFGQIDSVIMNPHDEVWIGEFYETEAMNDFVGVAPINPEYIG